LLTYCIDFATTMLKDSGEFHPFGAVLDPSGEVRAVGAYNGEEHPRGSELYELLSGAFADEASAGKIMGAALAANVDVPAQFDSPLRDAVRVTLEASGYSRLIYWPYKIERKGFLKRQSDVQFGDPFAVEMEPQFFSRP
jgi:hypothetical protein